MPTTVLITPQALMPAYNPVVFAFTSTTNTNIGFRYLVDVYSGNTTTNLIARLKVTPGIFGDGYIDISRIVQNYVTESANFTLASNTNVVEAYLNYNVRLGEEYLATWPYTSVTSAATGTFAGLTVLRGPTGSTYVAGDQINITTTPSGQTAIINGLQSVVSAATNQNIIKLTYPGTGTIILTAGTTTYADLRKIQFTGQTIITGLTVVNTALDWPVWKAWVANNYIVTSATSATDFLLTSLQPQSDVINKFRRVYVTPSQDMWFNFYTSSPTTNFSWTRTHFDKNGLSKGALTITLGGGTGNVKQFKMGFNATTATPVVEGDFIQFRVVNTTTGLPVTRPYVLYADTQCAKEETQIYFQDRYGSILSQAFTLISQNKIDIERDIIKQAIIYGANSSLDLSQPGSTITNVGINRTYDLATNWLTDAQIELIEELVTSKYTWMLIGTDYLPVVVQDKGYEITYQRNKRLQRKNITVQLANQRPLN